MPTRVAMLLLLAVFLPACGSQTDEQGASRTGQAPVERRALQTMVVRQQDVGGLPAGLRVAPESGWTDNRAEAESSLAANDSAVSLAKAGRLTGYVLTYYDPAQAAVRAGRGVDSFTTWVELFATDRAASAYLRKRVAASRARAHTAPARGISFGAVEPFAVPMAADESFGLREPIDADGHRVTRTLIGFRRGRIVAGVMVVRADTVADLHLARRIAGVLDTRIQIGVHGGGGVANGEPAPVSKTGVAPDGQQPTAKRPAGVPDLEPIALGPDDLPPGIPCLPGRYTHTTPPRITYRRSFCPQGRAIGHTRLVSLANEVSVYKLEELAKASMILSSRMALSPEGAKILVANFAATSGLVATNVHSKRVELGDDDVGMLTTFDTKVGRVADFYALAQNGRGVTSLDAIGPAEGFDIDDLAPLLKAVEHRLDELG